MEKRDDGRERSPLMVASEKCELEISRLLVGKGAEVDETNGKLMSDDETSRDE